MSASGRKRSLGAWDRPTCHRRPLSAMSGHRPLPKNDAPRLPNLRWWQVENFGAQGGHKQQYRFANPFGGSVWPHVLERSESQLDRRVFDTCMDGVNAQALAVFVVTHDKLVCKNVVVFHRDLRAC